MHGDKVDRRGESNQLEANGVGEGVGTVAGVDQAHRGVLQRELLPQHSYAQNEFETLGKPPSMIPSRPNPFLLKFKCSDWSMEVKLPAHLGNYDRPATDQSTIRQTNQPSTNQQTDGQTGS